MAEVERACNEAIVANVEVGISFPDAEALEKLAYRSKKALKGDVRIVERARMRPLRMLRRAREEHGRDRPHQGALLR